MEGGRLGVSRSGQIVLAGDTHNGWASDLDDYQGNPIGVEFATPTECQAEWRYVDTVKSLNYSVVAGQILRTLPGVGNRRIVPVA